jgi:hypothetical protein
MYVLTQKTLEQVMDVLKVRIAPTLSSDPNHSHGDKPIVNKIRKGKKQQSSDLNFVNKRSGRLISRGLRNRKKDHLRSISTIKVNDHCLDEDINDFLAKEDPDNQCLKNEIVVQAKPYDFVSRLPMFLKGQEGFVGLIHDLKQVARKHERPIVEYIPPQPSIAPVHCDNCLDWVEHYYRDIPLLQVQVKHMLLGILYLNEKTKN